MKSKISDEIWLRNEGLPTGEGLFQLYIWFCKERGFNIDRVIEDLNENGNDDNGGEVVGVQHARRASEIKKRERRII